MNLNIHSVGFTSDKKLAGFTIQAGSDVLNFTAGLVSTIGAICNANLI